LGLFVVVLANAAWASPSARLVYALSKDAQSCGDEAQLRRAVARRLGYDPFVVASDTTVVVEFRREGEGLKSRIFLIESGHALGFARELLSKSKQCDELLLSSALAISIAIDPESLERLEVEAPAPSTPKVAQPAEQPDLIARVTLK
jgi:hypothetical protein